MLVPIADAATKRVSCSSIRTLNAAIASLKPGDTLLVSGTCNENVTVSANLANVTIDNVVVSGAATNGIVITQGSFGRVINSNLHNNLNGCGIVVSENSSARIGFLAASDEAASPNVIQNNDDGVCISRNSNARVAGNNINNNTNHGVFINTVSHADVSSNDIDNNGGQGIQVGRNSGVNLGTDSGDSIFIAPNRTTTNNGQFGLRCFINSYADGRLGTLNGASGQTDFGSGCINSTSP